jgi:hypothetical protein
MNGRTPAACAPPEECRLAYDLQNWPGRVCSRKGGASVCGECIRDIDAPAMGFRRVREQLQTGES